jgi:general secretion pathway protein K
MTPQTTRKPPPGESGMALFVVLAFLLLVAAVITPVTVVAHVEALVTRNAIRETQDRFAMEGAIRLAGAVYAERIAMSRERPNDRIPRTVVCFDDSGSSQAVFSFINHSGLIDLNGAPPELMQLGFQALGMDSSLAADFAQEALRYRSAEQGKEGGEDSRYKRAPFETVFELADLTSGEKRIDGTLLFEIAPAVFSVHSETGIIDVNQLQGRLRAQVQKIGTRGAPFLVENAGRLPALTVRARVFRTGRVIIAGTGIFTVNISEEGTELRTLEPLRLESINPEAGPVAIQANDNTVSGCDALFGARQRQALFEVLQ